MIPSSIASADSPAARLATALEIYLDTLGPIEALLIGALRTLCSATLVAPASPTTAVAALALAIGFTISTVTQNQLQAMQASFFLMLPSILLSGFMFPFKGMPDWAQAIGTAIPVTHFLRIVRGALLKGLGLGEVWPSLAALGVFVCLVTAAAMLRYRRTLD